MQDKVIGSTMPVLEISLDPGESVISEAGEFSWMSDAIELSMSTGSGQQTQGLGTMAGIGNALKRMAGGGSFFFNTYTASGGAGLVSFAAKLPGHIFPVDVEPGAEYLGHRHAFLAGTPGIEISVALQQSFSSGIFGGEGFLLQHISGSGKAWIELSGEVITYDLVAGQSMRVHPGHVGLFQSTVNFSVVRVPGITNRYLGGDGHHFAVMTGPGRIWLQSMPLPLLAGALAPYIEKDDGGGRHGAMDAGLAGGAAGGILGNLLGGGNR